MKNEMNSKSDRMFADAIEACRNLSVPQRPSDEQILARLSEARSRETIASMKSGGRGSAFAGVRIFRYAASALIAGIVLSVLVQSLSPSIAMAEVLQKVKNHQLVRYSMVQIADAGEGHPKGETKSIVYADLHSPRFREEKNVEMLGPNGKSRKARYVTITDQTKLTMLSLGDRPSPNPDQPNMKSASFTLIENTGKTFFEHLEDIEKSGDAEHSRETLDDIDVHKYALKSKDTTTTLWVDAETRLPVRMEYSMNMSAGDVREYKWVMTDFEWDPKVDDAENLFSISPPEGYDVWLPADELPNRE